MKAVILAGGYGTRISEETETKPKPMIEIGGMPILWHIMKIYSQHGVNEFVICAGYKGYVIKEYFANYFLHMSNITFDMSTNEMQVHENNSEPWKVTIVDTGDGTMTGGRIKRIRDYIGNETFCMTYGDGVSNIGTNETVELLELVEAVEKASGINAHKNFGHEKPGDVKQTWANISKAEKYFDYKLKTSISEGLSHFSEWYSSK